MSTHRPRAHNTEKSGRRFYNTTFSSITRKTTPKTRSPAFYPPPTSVACNRPAMNIKSRSSSHRTFRRLRRAEQDEKVSSTPNFCGYVLDTSSRRISSVLSIHGRRRQAGILTSNGPAFKSCASPILSASPRRPPRTHRLRFWY